MKLLIVKISITIALFLCTFIVFKLLQRPAVYNATLKHITHTYVRDDVDSTIVWKVDNPYYWRDQNNALRWDGLIYYEIRENWYNPDPLHPGDYKYGVFPLFSILWKIFPIGILYIGMVNYLLFGIALILLSIFVFKEEGITNTKSYALLLLH